jgi:hypothetical protein
MSVAKVLQEMDTTEIVAELNRRIDDRDNDLCDYCHHPVGEPVAHLNGGDRSSVPHCEKPGRHAGAQDENNWSSPLVLPTTPFDPVD